MCLYNYILIKSFYVCVCVYMQMYVQVYIFEVLCESSRCGWVNRKWSLFGGSGGGGGNGGQQSKFSTK